MKKMNKTLKIIDSISIDLNNFKRCDSSTPVIFFFTFAEKVVL